MNTEELESYMNMTQEELHEAYANIHGIKERCEILRYDFFDKRMTEKEKAYVL